MSTRMDGVHMHCIVSKHCFHSKIYGCSGRLSECLVNFTVIVELASIYKIDTVVIKKIDGMSSSCFRPVSL